MAQPQTTDKLQIAPSGLGSETPKCADDQGSSLALLKILAEASAVFIAFTFVGGWSYLAAYYRAFGLNALEFDVPVPVVCTTALYVLFDAKWPLPVVAGLIVAWILVSRRLPHARRFGGTAMLGLCLLTISVSGVLHGREQAIAEITEKADNLPYVAFASKLPQNEQPSCVEFQTYGDSDCKLLLHTRGTYYFFQPVLVKGYSFKVYSLADAEVSGVYIQRGFNKLKRANDK